MELIRLKSGKVVDLAKVFCFDPNTGEIGWNGGHYTHVGDACEIDEIFSRRYPHIASTSEADDANRSRKMGFRGD